MTTVDDLRHAFELDRLAEELGVGADELDGLEALPADDLAHLRHQLAAGLVAHHAPVFDAFAQASALVPAALAAGITKRVIGPALAGRMAGSMSPGRAAAIMGHLDTAFLADSCRTLSADAAAGLLPAIDDVQVLATTRELAARDDHATLGRFVDALGDERLRTVLAVLDLPRHLLLAGAATGNAAALDRVVRLLPPARRASIVGVAPAHPEAAATVLVRLTPGSRALLLEAVADLPDADVGELLDGLADAARGSSLLRAAAASLPGPELAAAAARLDRSEDLQGALGRLTMAVLDIEEAT